MRDRALDFGVVALVVAAGLYAMLIYPTVQASAFERFWRLVP